MPVLVASRLATGQASRTGWWRRLSLLWLAFLLFGLAGQTLARGFDGEQIPTIELRDLPVEARNTLALIRQGGPFPWPKDGSVFGNYEGVLPKQKRGYYHEFTVNTPGLRGRGARRIIVGGNWQTSRDIYYTGNHYASFSRIKE